MATSASEPRADPRGPLRTITEATWMTFGYRVRFAECGHVGTKNATMKIRVGERARCFTCAQEAEREGMAQAKIRAERDARVREDSIGVLGTWRDEA